MKDIASLKLELISLKQNKVENALHLGLGVYGPRRKFAIYAYFNSLWHIVQNAYFRQIFLELELHIFSEAEKTLLSHGIYQINQLRGITMK